MKKYAVIIPIYQVHLNSIEKMSLDNNIHRLRNHHIYFLMPRSLDICYFCDYDNVKIIRFDDRFFKNYHTYSRLLISEEFYQAFEAYEKILICQLDVYVFEDRMTYFGSLPYDYIGAPAFLYFHEDGGYEVHPGNGGFSLRDVKHILHFLSRHKKESDEWKETEDEFFSYCSIKYPEEFRMAPISVAASFSFDRFASVMYEWMNQKIPFGMHAWHIYAPQIVYQFATTEQRHLLDSILEKKTSKEILCPFYEFLSRNVAIVLYGAGDWGKMICRALKILQVDVVCFAVSEGHMQSEQKIFGIPVYYWSEIKDLPDGVGVILSMSQRYLPMEEKQKLHSFIRSRGIEEILDVDNQLYNFIEEIILRKGKGMFSVHEGS